MSSADFVLVDTSVWIEHLRNGSPLLQSLLEDKLVCTHDMIIAELALGNIGADGDFLNLLQNLRVLPTVNPDELLFFITQQKLAQQGIGFVDANLLASTMLVHGARLLTKDKHLTQVAQRLGIAY